MSLELGDTAKLLWILVFHLALTAAPGVGATLFAARRGVRDVPVLLGIGLAGTGVAAMLAFWAYFLDPSFGQVCAWAILIGSIALAVACLPSLRAEPELLRSLATPLLLWALGSAFLVYLGFLHGGTDAPVSMSTARFSSTLPNDNDIPRFFSNWFFAHGHHGTPPHYPGDWLSSDRPPLQIGYVLAQRTFAWDEPGLHYQVLGVVLQQLWIVGLWALLVAARIRGTTRALAIGTVLLSDVAIVNGFFVWPKLLAASFVLAAAALVAAPGRSTLRERPATLILLGALAALAMLSHGGSAFALIPLLVVAALRGIPEWRWAVAGLVAAVVLLVPWSEYQRRFDPPGNRVSKWMLAGQTGVDDRSTATAVWAAYRDVGFGGAFENKVHNFDTITGARATYDYTKSAVDDLTSGDAADAVRALRIPRFFCLLPSLGLFLLAPLAMLVGRREGSRDTDEWRFATIGLAIVVAAAVVWALLLFGSTISAASVHQGTLALPLLALCVAVVGLRATYRRAAVALAAVNALLVLALYIPYVSPPAGSAYSASAALLAIASLAGFARLAMRGRLTAGAEAAGPDRSVALQAQPPGH